ncbi:MAG: hypothetical protein ACTSR8_18210 [Promethearchaeota archaeon]
MVSEIIETDLVILGHIAKDIITIDGVSESAVGGAVYFGGIAGSHMGLRIMVITRLKKEDFDILEDFKKNGIRYFAYPSEETSGIENIYNSINQETRICKPHGFAGLFQKEEIPELKTKYFILAPIIAGEITLNLLKYLTLKYPNKICIDIQGFVRVRDLDKNELHFCNLSEEQKREILSHVTILKVDHAELKALTRTEDIKEGASILANLGPREILISHEKGLSLYTENNLYFYPWKYRYIKGRTGRGDTSFVSYIGSRISKDPEESLKFSAALTSLKLESPGPFTDPLNLVEELIKKEYQ